MPESFEEATTVGARRGVRNFFSSFGTHAGKIVAYVAGAVFVIWFGFFMLERMWAGFTSPVRGAFEWVGDKAGGASDWVGGWWSDGEDTVDAVTDVVEEVIKEVPAEGSTEPGPICSRWSKLNPFCD